MLQVMPQEEVKRDYNWLTKEHFESVVSRVIDQVFGEGKGAKRHGGDGNIPLEKQPWAFISDQIDSPDFCVGQAIKKLSELKGKSKANQYGPWITEILGAIAYSIFAMMYEEYKQETEMEKNREKFKKETGRYPFENWPKLNLPSLVSNKV